MGAFVVELFPKLVEAHLLLEEVGLGGPGCFLLEGEVHPFVAAILLRPSGLDPLYGDPESQPPHGKGAEPKEGVGRGKGDPVVASDGHWQSPRLTWVATDFRHVL